MQKRITVLIADDSAMMRRTLRNIIEADPDLEVAGVARDGVDAVAKARELKPDVVTMDINMPEMDGLTALQIILDEKLSTVIMVSSLTQEGAVTTFEALELGAFDYVGKPGGTVSANFRQVADELVEKIKAAAASSFHLGRSRKKSRSGIGGKARSSRVSSKDRRRTVRRIAQAGSAGFNAVAIGISTGGPRTIMDVLPLLPENLNAAVFLVQHMPPGFTSSFAQRLDQHCMMTCVEAEAGMIVEPGMIYLGRGGKHMTLFKKGSGDIMLRTPSIPKHTFMPSADVMMESVLKVFGRSTIGVIMTGMGDDGAEAICRIGREGGVTVAESKESAIVFGMPRAAIELCDIDMILPAWEIADAIIESAGVR